MRDIESITIQGALAALMTMISYYCGIVAVPIIVLVAVMIIDYVTGMVAAWKGKELSSKKGVFGIVKKVCYLALVCVGMGVDWLIYSGLRQVGVALDYTIFFGVLVTVWLVINELISILENLKKIGVPLPKFLIALIKRLKITTEKKFENEEEKNND
jgi:toxin secretion/phage lysis holin